MDGPENGDEIVAAIVAFRANHKPEETENAVRLWYEKYDELLAAAIRENLDLRSLREANVTQGYELCEQGQDYRKCELRRRAENRGARHDSRAMLENNQMEVRLQHAFMTVRNGLLRYGLHYSWFKIRTTNNIDRF